MRLSRREMRGLVLTRLGQQLNPTIEKKTVNDALNDAHRKLCKDLPLNRSSWSASAVSGQRTYAPPPKLSELDRVDFNDRELGFTLLEDIFRFGEDVSITTPTWTEDI